MSQKRAKKLRQLARVIAAIQDKRVPGEFEGAIDEEARRMKSTPAERRRALKMARMGGR